MSSAKLTFNLGRVAEILSTTAAAQVGNRRTVYDDLCCPKMRKPDAVVTDGFVASSDELDPAKIPQGILLVGDHGIYLMSGAKDDRSVVYARECDPTTMPFDEWWEAKQELYGGDDGVERIELSKLSGLMRFINERKAQGENIEAGMIQITVAASRMTLACLL